MPVMSMMNPISQEECTDIVSVLFLVPMLSQAERGDELQVTVMQHLPFHKSIN